MSDKASVSGVVSWLHPKSNPGWSLADIDGEDRRKTRICAKFGLSIGQIVNLNGEWSVHPKWGRQFTATGMEVGKVSLSGLKIWLERNVPGCGPVKAEAAASIYGDDLYDAITNRPEEVANKVGLNAALLAEAAANLTVAKGDADAVGRLKDRGCPITLAVKIIKALHPEIVDTVLANPYYLIGRVDRVAWKTADELAHSFGIAKNASCRLHAAVDFACTTLSESEGHTAYLEETLLKSVTEALGIDPRWSKEALAISEKVEKQGELWVHAKYAKYERQIEESVLNNEILLDEFAIDRLAERFAVLPNGRLEGKQMEAFRAALKYRVCVITGGAGVGKTTIISCIANALDNVGNSPLLSAPTGKAAVRISESTGRNAITLHRLLGLGIDGATNTKNPPPASFATAVVVDEQSMTDVWLMSKLVTTIQPHCRLILVGDPNQLPSVGPGSVLRDMINSKKVPHVHLDTCHRQAGLLRHNCYSVLSGGRKELFDVPDQAEWPTAPWVFVKTQNSDSIEQGLCRLFAGSCVEKFGIDQYALMVVTPTNKGGLGTFQLNRTIQIAYQKAVNDRVVTYRADEKRPQFHPGDRVVWTKNNYQLNLMNGEIGRVAESLAGGLKVQFDTRGEMDIPQESLEQLALAWVMTCHKMQGSQARKIIVICAHEHANHYGLRNILNRSWFYTAVTRSQETTVLLGDPDSIRQVIARDQKDGRITTLFQVPLLKEPQ